MFDLLPFYAILRSIPNKLLGVIAMFSAILIILTMPFTDLSRSRGIQFRPLSKIAFFIFLGNFLILMKLGAKHVESPFIEFGQISTALYFSYFLIIVPAVTLLENSLIELATLKDENTATSSQEQNISLNYSYSINIATLYNKIANVVYTKKSMIVLLSTLVLYVINLNISSKLLCDAPRPWGLYFQDSGTPQMEGLVELHDNILFYLVIILFAVMWILVSILRMNKNNGAVISHRFIGHGTFVELVWTITPAFILILITFPSFKLLFLMDEVSDPAMAVLAEGHQWYWSYQYPDFVNSDYEFIEFDSYLVPESDLDEGALRMLEVDNRLIIPELTHVRFMVTAADVIHSFACPSLGIKCDAYPGRLNQVSVMLNREGTFYGQCSEICGILHSSMPIVLESISVDKFVSWLTVSIIPFTLKINKKRSIRYISPNNSRSFDTFTKVAVVSGVTSFIIRATPFIVMGGCLVISNCLRYYALPDPIEDSIESCVKFDTKSPSYVTDFFAHSRENVHTTVYGNELFALMRSIRVLCNDLMHYIYLIRGVSTEDFKLLLNNELLDLRQMLCDSKSSLIKVLSHVIHWINHSNIPQGYQMDLNSWFVRTLRCINEVIKSIDAKDHQAILDNLMLLQDRVYMILVSLGTALWALIFPQHVGVPFTRSLYHMLAPGLEAVGHPFQPDLNMLDNIVNRDFYEFYTILLSNI